MIPIEFITNKNDFSLSIELSEFNNLIQKNKSKINKYREEKYSQGSVKIFFEIPEADRNLIEKFDNLINSLSYRLLKTSLIFHSYNEVKTKYITSGKNLTKHFITKNLKINIDDVIINTFKTNTNDRIVYTFIPIDKEGRKIYINNNVLIEFLYEFNINTWYEYNFSSYDPMSVHSWNTSIENENFLGRRPSDKMIYFKNCFLTNLLEDDLREHDFNIALEIRNKDLASQGYFPVVLDNYHIGKKDLIKEIAEMWSIEFVRDYEDENILIFKTNKDFFDTTKENWLLENFERVIQNQFPKVNIKGPWTIERLDSGKVLKARENGFSRESITHLEYLRAIINYLAIRAYDKIAHSGKPYLFNNIHIKVRDDLSVDVELCCYQDYVDFQKTLIEIYSDSLTKKLAVSFVHNIEELFIVYNFLLLKFKESEDTYHPLAFEDLFYGKDKYFIVFDDKYKSIIEKINYEKEKESLLKSFEKYYSTSGYKLKNYLNDIVEVAREKNRVLFLTPEDKKVYQSKYFRKEIIKKTVEEQFLKLRILGLSDIGPIKGLSGKSYVNKFLISPPEGYLILSRNYNKDEDALEKEIIGKVYSLYIRIERSKLSYHILDISIKEDIKEAEQLLINIWSCGFLLSKWCTAYIFMTSKLSLFIRENDHIYNSGSDSIDDGEILIRKLRLINEYYCQSENLNDKIILDNEYLNVLTLKVLD